MGEGANYQRHPDPARMTNSAGRFGRRTVASVKPPLDSHAPIYSNHALGVDHLPQAPGMDADPC